jgi:hypothetical protein
MKEDQLVSIVADGKRRRGKVLAITGSGPSTKKVLSIEYSVDGKKQQRHNVNHFDDANVGSEYWLLIGEKLPDAEPPVDSEDPVPLQEPTKGTGNADKPSPRRGKTQE